jgi:hypothetical protein
MFIHLHGYPIDAILMEFLWACDSFPDRIMECAMYSWVDVFADSSAGVGQTGFPHDFDGVLCLATGAVLDLVPATRAGCRQPYSFTRISNCRKQDQFSDALRDIIMFGLITKAAGHPATAGWNDFDGMA